MLQAYTVEVLQVQVSVLNLKLSYPTKAHLPEDFRPVIFESVLEEKRASWDE